MRSAKNGCCNHTVRRFVRRLILGTGKVIWLSLSVLALSSSTLAQTKQPPSILKAGGRATAEQPLPDPPRAGSVSGTVLDPTGAPVAGARVVLARAEQSSYGMLHLGENSNAPPIMLALPTTTTEINVFLPPVEVAEAGVKAEVKQRVFGVIPNFYVSYLPDPTPLDTKQKFELAWKTVIDPVTFGLTGAIAGVQQAQGRR